MVVSTHPHHATPYHPATHATPYHPTLPHPQHTTVSIPTHHQVLSGQMIHSNMHWAQIHMPTWQDPLTQPTETCIGIGGWGWCAPWVWVYMYVAYGVGGCLKRGVYGVCVCEGCACWYQQRVHACCCCCCCCCYTVCCCCYDCNDALVLYRNNVLHYNTPYANNPLINSQGSQGTMFAYGMEKKGWLYNAFWTNATVRLPFEEQDGNVQGMYMPAVSIVTRFNAKGAAMDKLREFYGVCGWVGVFCAGWICWFIGGGTAHVASCTISTL